VLDKFLGGQNWAYACAGENLVLFKRCIYDHIYACMYNCVLSKSSCVNVFISQITLKHLYKSYNFICIFTTIVQIVKLSSCHLNVKTEDD
jgi:hypothetical protein